jgi:hypothetical protein
MSPSTLPWPRPTGLCRCLTSNASKGDTSKASKSVPVKPVKHAQLRTESLGPVLVSAGVSDCFCSQCPCCTGIQKKNQILTIKCWRVGI